MTTVRFLRPIRASLLAAVLTESCTGFTALLRRFIRLRGAYKPCRRSCGKLALTQFRRFPVLTEGRTTFWANECSIESPGTATHGRRTPYFREAGN